MVKLWRDLKQKIFGAPRVRGGFDHERALLTDLDGFVIAVLSLVQDFSVVQERLAEMHLPLFALCDSTYPHATAARGQVVAIKDLLDGAFGGPKRERLEESVFL